MPEEQKHDEAITRNHILAEAFTGKGELHEKEDEYEEALDAYEQALRLNPGDEKAFQGRKRMKELIFLFPPKPPPPPGPYPGSPYPYPESAYPYPAGSQPEYSGKQSTYPGQQGVGLPTQPIVVAQLPQPKEHASTEGIAALVLGGLTALIGYILTPVLFLTVDANFQVWVLVLSSVCALVTGLFALYLGSAVQAGASRDGKQTGSLPNLAETGFWLSYLTWCVLPFAVLWHVLYGFGPRKAGG